MKAAGVIRKLDNLGRIVLPMELRRTMDIKENDALEIFVEGEQIILRKYAPGCIFCDEHTNHYVNGKLICNECLSIIKSI